MADVFVSYARSDELFAERVAEGLRGEGYQVWRDDELPAHRAYADVIQERLSSAGAVVVLWSADAVTSQWVRAEADVARAAGTLVQVTVDGCIPPLPFNQYQCANLQAWDGNATAPGWRKLTASVSALVGAMVQSDKQQPKKSNRQVSVCVLPFANMSGDAEQEYFSDGISEDITTDLSKVSALGVTARNTAFTFKGQAVNICDVARNLGVSHVLEGSVRKVGNRVRITAQLIDGGTGDHVWAERYDRDLTDIFVIQDEISRSIVRALKLKLLPEEKKAIKQRGTTNVEAYNLYLLARQYWITGNHGDIRREQRVMRISGRAVELDPYYAQAWALLAIAQSNLRYNFGSEIEDGVAAAHTALAIDPSIAEAHCPMVRRLEERGLFDEAGVQMTTALGLDPESWEVNKEAARVCMRERQWDAATRHLEKAVSIIETDIHAWGMLVTCYHALGDGDAERKAAEMSIAQAEQILSKDPSNGAAMSFGARGFAALGKVDHAEEWMARAMLVDCDNLDMRYNFAGMLAAYLGNQDGALRLLRRNFSSISKYHLRIAESDPDLDSLRADPRFSTMLSRARTRLGIPDDGALGPPDTLPAPFKWLIGGQ
ncbi:TIR domain-containing protein [Sphingomonas sp.]|uniref:TIR domain-containing protein n=1 Tax=Sphingomonas sp. TaxID=28214 RepID=UPI00286C2FEB|nr:TIR domain-containing protein [Sphingomonas sp.]